MNADALRAAARINGAPLPDQARPMGTITAGELRAAADRMDALEAALKREPRPISSIPEEVRVLVWVADKRNSRGKKEGVWAFGMARRYIDGAPPVVSAEGYSGDWKITKWAPLPPLPGEAS